MRACSRRVIYRHGGPARHASGPDTRACRPLRMRPIFGVTPMKTMLWIVGFGLILAGGRPALAYYCEDGQLPAPPEVAARMALPLCGFAATKRWGPNGCQLC